ncbi:hypothetical protein JCM6882_008062 [Rhodosporidiobolus microsporus]
MSPRSVPWVPGHVGVEGNERADELANTASDEAKADEDALAKRAVPQARRRRGGGFFRREMMYGEEGEETDGDRTVDSNYASEQHLSTPARVALDTRQRPNSSPRAYTTAPSPTSPDVIPDGRLLPKSVSALQQAHRAALLAEWAHRWRTSTTGASLRRVDPRPPGPPFSRPLSSLPRRHAVLLTRVRTNFVDLGARRFWLAEGDEGRMCKRCGEEETREHVVLECEAYEEARGELRRKPGSRSSPGMEKVIMARSKSRDAGGLSRCAITLVFTLLPSASSDSATSTVSSAAFPSLNDTSATSFTAALAAPASFSFAATLRAIPSVSSARQFGVHGGSSPLARAASRHQLPSAGHSNSTNATGEGPGNSSSCMQHK